jgi:hypothetical protein
MPAMHRSFEQRACISASIGSGSPSWPAASLSMPRT